METKLCVSSLAERLSEKVRSNHRTLLWAISVVFWWLNEKSGVEGASLLVVGYKKGSCIALLVDTVED